MKILFLLWLLISPVGLMARVIKNDFLVNDDTIGGPTDYFPEVAMNGKGNFVAVWRDSRRVIYTDIEYTFSGGCDIDMYGQVYGHLGRPIGENFKINDGEFVAGNPSVAMDSAGNFVVVWVGWKNEKCRILGKRFNPSGKPLSGEFQISLKCCPTGEGSWYKPSIAMNPAGEFVVVWKEKIEGESKYRGNLCGRMYDSLGNPKGDVFKIDTGFVYMPSVAMDYSGAFAVVWWRGFVGTVEVQRYYRSGIPKGKKFIVTEDCFPGLNQPPTVDIAMDSAGDFSIVWEDTGDIYLQDFDYKGSPLDTIRKVNDDTINWDPGQIWPTISMDKSGKNTIVAWHDNRNISQEPDRLITDIYAQRYDSQHHPIGRNFRVNERIEGMEEEFHLYSSTGMDDYGNFIIVWVDNRTYPIKAWGGCPQVYGQRYNYKGEPESSNFQIKDGGVDIQWCPSVSMNKNGDFVVTWTDFRRSGLDTYCQIYDKWGNPKGNNFWVNDTTSEEWSWRANNAFNSRVAINDKGEFAVIWMDAFSSSNNYAMGQCYNSSGKPIGTNFLAHPDENFWACTWYDPALAMKSNGDFLLISQWTVNDCRNLYGAFFDIAGEAKTDFLGPIGENPLKPSEFYYYYSSLTMDRKGNFIAIWLYLTGGELSSSLYGQRIDSLGNLLGKNFRVDETGTVRMKGRPSLDAGDKGNFVVVWEDVRDDSLADIFCQRYDSEGNPIGKNFKVNDDPGGVKQRYPSVAMNPVTSEFVIFWTDFRYKDPVVMAQKYDAFGNPVRENVQISESGDSYKFTWRNSVDASEDRIVFVWSDNRRNKGWDVYCKITDWNLLGIEERRGRMPVSLKVFPNPVKGMMDVRYEIPVKGVVSFKLYDASGRVVKTIFKGKDIKSGAHKMTISTKGLSSGVYFLRLKTPQYSFTKKVILLE